MCAFSDATALAKLNGLFPLPPQSLADSPLLDASLFRYDDRSLSTVDRAQQAPETAAVRFFSRTTQQPVFSLDASSGAGPDGYDGYSLTRLKYCQRCMAVTPRKFVTWIWHPFLPLAITMLHTVIRPSVVNVHLFRRLQHDDEGHQVEESSQ